MIFEQNKVQKSPRTEVYDNVKHEPAFLIFDFCTYSHPHSLKAFETKICFQIFWAGDRKLQPSAKKAEMKMNSKWGQEKKQISEQILEMKKKCKKNEKKLVLTCFRTLQK